ncbi:MAG: hypothetical protein R2694_07375 [Ilumatobacteraceae bacterium]
MNTRNLHHVRNAALSLLPFALLGIAACSTTQSTAPTETTLVTAVAETTIPVTEAPTTTPVAETTPATDLLPAPETVPPLPPAVTMPPLPTLPPGPPPTWAIPPVIIPIPLCATADAEHEPVEIHITDWGVQVNGDDPPACMRIPESFALTFVNNAEGDATVGFGFGGNVLAAGEEATTSPLGEFYFVGDTFEITVAELGVVIEVTVIAA